MLWSGAAEAFISFDLWSFFFFIFDTFLGERSGLCAGSHSCPGLAYMSTILHCCEPLNPKHYCLTGHLEETITIFRLYQSQCTVSHRLQVAPGSFGILYSNRDKYKGSRHANISKLSVVKNLLRPAYT